MLLVRDAEALVQECVAEGFDHPGAIFHTNTVSAAKRRSRGVQGELADKDVQSAILSKVKTIDV